MVSLTEKDNMIELIDADLLVEEKLDERYVNSPFKHLKNIPAKQKTQKCASSGTHNTNAGPGH